MNHQQGKLDQAEKLNENSLQMKLAIYGSDTPHQHIALSFHAIGRVYEGQNKLDQAEMYKKALEMRLAILESDRSHPNVVSLYWSLWLLQLRSLESSMVRE